MSKKYRFILGFCAFFFCASISFGQPTDTCLLWHNLSVANVQSYSEAKSQFDTAHRYIESCSSDANSWQVFQHISADLQYLSTSPLTTPLLDSFRDWLISVLYFNKTEPRYFCQCVFAMAQTYPSQKYNSSTVGNMPNAALAIVNVLRADHGCDDFEYDSLYVQSIRSRHQAWVDQQRITKTGPEDTTIPPLDSIGLGFLDPKNGVIQDASSSGIQFLTSFTTSPNPFQNEITFDFTLTRMAYIQLAIYDELGRLVWGDGRNSSLEAGAHALHIDGNNFPSGTLYARILTGFGEVKTVKLVHEK